MSDITKQIKKAVAEFLEQAKQAIASNETPQIDTSRHTKDYQREMLRQAGFDESEYPEHLKN
jgi:hypothetical protein